VRRFVNIGVPDDRIPRAIAYLNENTSDQPFNYLIARTLAHLAYFERRWSISTGCIYVVCLINWLLALSVLAS